MYDLGGERRLHTGTRCRALRPQRGQGLLGKGDELGVARRTRGHEAVLEHPSGGEREPVRVTGVARCGCGAAQHLAMSWAARAEEHLPKPDGEVDSQLRIGRVEPLATVSARS